MMCDCNGSGKLPFVKDGKVIKHAFTYYDCHRDDDKYRPVMVEDFDYPMSDTFRAHSFIYCGQQDKGYSPEPVEEKPQVIEHIVRHSDMGKKEYDQLQQVMGEVKYLHGKIDEKPVKPKVSAYKGIR